MNNYKIVIDAGHGGSDPGASGNGIIEKDLTLKISQYMYDRFRELGIPVTINTDDMAIEGITLEEEYRYMENEFGLTSEQKKIILNNAVHAAFTSAAVKEELKKELGLAK